MHRWTSHLGAGMAVHESTVRVRPEGGWKNFEYCRLLFAVGHYVRELRKEL